MSGFSDDFIEQVRNASDIVELISEQVNLEQRGQDLWGLCPFHSEKTPSFSVSPSKQMYYCFGCQASGTVFTFLMETAKLPFPEAVRTLASRANIPLPAANAESPAVQAKRNERRLLYRVNEWAAKFFAQQLQKAPDAKEANDYLAGRGLTVDLIKQTQIGYAPDSWTGLVDAANRNKVPTSALAKLGLIVPRKQNGFYDRFRARVMIPITDERGRIVAFGGRVLDDAQPKYLNSPESTLFDKGKLLFGLHFAGTAISKAGYAVLVEGYMDCLAAWQYGIGQVVASLGTALTPHQARLLKRYTKQVVLCYDADSSGLRAALRGLDVLAKAGLQVKVASLPSGQDPDDCLRQYGAQYFLTEIIDKALPIVDFQLAMLRRNYNLETVDGKAQFVLAAAAILAELDNEVAKTAYAQQIAIELQVPEAAVFAELVKQKQASGRPMRDKLGNSRNTTRSVDSTVLTEPDPVLRGFQVAEDKLLSLILQNSVDSWELLSSWQEIDAYAYPIDRELVEILKRELAKDPVLNVRRLREQDMPAELSQRVAQLAWVNEIAIDNAVAVANDCLRKLKQLSIRQSISALQGQLLQEKNAMKRKNLLQELQKLIEKQKGLRH